MNIFASAGFLYEPFTEFKERPYAGKYVHVEQNGFRVSKNQGMPPDRKHYFTVFSSRVSTAFGSEFPTIKPLLPIYRSS